MHHVLFLVSNLVVLVFGRRVVCCNDKNQGVGYSKPELGVVEEINGRREVENIEDGSVNEYREEECNRGSCTRFVGFLRIMFFKFVASRRTNHSSWWCFGHVYGEKG